MNGQQKVDELLARLRRAGSASTVNVNAYALGYLGQAATSSATGMRDLAEAVEAAEKFAAANPRAAS